MSSAADLKRVEDLFLEKLSEKYRLTERDIKRAFAKFDTDNSGFLSVDELSAAISQFLNGVGRDAVAKLVQYYDVDGDGTISISEFAKFVLSRSGNDKSRLEAFEALMAPRPSSAPRTSSAEPSVRRRKYSDIRSPAADRGMGFNAATAEESELELQVLEEELGHAALDESDNVIFGSDDQDAAYEAKVFLQNLRSYLIRTVADMRKKRQVSGSNQVRTQILKEDLLGLSTTQFFSTQARKILLSAFAPHLKAATGNVVNFNSFARVLLKFVYPGADDPSREAVEHIFQLCLVEDLPRSSEPMANPSKLVDLMFEKGTAVSRFGFVTDAKSSVETRRDTVGKGPFERTVSIEDKVHMPLVPQRFVIKKSRTSLATPSNFDYSMVERSSKLPNYDLKRSFVFGLNPSLWSGNPVHCINQFCGSELTSKGAYLFASAALGVIYDAGSNTQHFFDGHTDDITCLALSSNGLVATGQTGKNAAVLVWDLKYCKSDHSQRGKHPYPIISENGLVAVVGQGFFIRGINSVSFSFDSKYICAIGCDDSHSLGIWDIATGLLVTSAPCHNGVPPQIKSLDWCPALQNAGFISKDLKTPCDIICTAGEKHLRLWAFSRSDDPARGPTAAVLMHRLAIMGKVDAEKAKSFLCTAFVPFENDIRIVEYDLMVGGINGIIYKFRQGVCILATSISTGSLSSIQLYGDQLIVGAAQGQIKVLNRFNFAELCTYSVHPTDISTAAAAVARPGSASSIAKRRPASAGPTRPSSSGSSRQGLSLGGPPAAGTPSGGRPSSGSAKKPAAAKIPSKTPDSAAAWTGPGMDYGKKAYNPPPPPEGVKASTDVLGIAINTGIPGQSDATGLVAVTGFGKALYVNTQDGAAENLLSFHYGPVWALATGTRAGVGQLCATGGDDKWLNIWSLDSNKLLTRVRTRFPVRCCHFNPRADFIAVGLAGGGISIFQISSGQSKSNILGGRSSSASATREITLAEVIYRKDCAEDISDIKFAPNGKMLAVGSHDNYIDIYSVSLSLPAPGVSGTSDIRYLKRLRGHGSYITHLDWSADSRLLQSTCGAYEILYWDIAAGRQLLSTTDALESDTHWSTFTSVLGFNVMGIWPPDADGTDINALEVAYDKGVVLTGDDSGHLNLMNYPCLVKNAPRITYGGHSSHVMNVRVTCPPAGAEALAVTVGGNDNSVMTWSIVRTAAPRA